MVNKYQYSGDTVQHNYFTLKTIHIVFIKVQQHKKGILFFIKNSFVCIFIVVIMYDFLSSPFCLYIGLMHAFVVSNTCHVKCKGLSVCNGVILLKKEIILLPPTRWYLLSGQGKFKTLMILVFGFVAIPS